MFRAKNDTTVLLVECMVNAATSADVTVEECDGGGASCVSIATGTCATGNTSLTLSNATVDAGDWLRLDVGSVTGSPGHVTVCVTFTE